MPTQPQYTVYQIGPSTFSVQGDDDHAKAAERLAAMLKHAVVPDTKMIYRRVDMAEAFAAGNSDAKIAGDGSMDTAARAYLLQMFTEGEKHQWEMEVRKVDIQPRKYHRGVQISEFISSAGFRSVVTILKPCNDGRNELPSSRDRAVTIHEDHFAGIYFRAREHLCREDGTHIVGDVKIASVLEHELTARGIDLETISAPKDVPGLSDDEFAASLDTLASDLTLMIQELERRKSNGERVQKLKDAYEALFKEYQQVKGVAP